MMPPGRRRPLFRPAAGGLFSAAFPRRLLRLGRRLLAGCDRCRACAGLLSWPGGGHCLCPDCAAALAPRLGGFCPLCGAMAEDPGALPLLCPDCRRSGRPWDGFAFHGRYDGVLRDLILGFKFRGDLGRGRLLAGLLTEAWERAALPVPDCLVPVALHPRRLSWRGFNQSLELARLPASRLDRPLLPRALRRIRDTRPQSSLPGPERRGNIQGAFVADPDRIGGQSVLLVDDVMTTGATIEAAAMALRQAGATRVDVLVAAR